MSFFDTHHIIAFLYRNKFLIGAIAALIFFLLISSQLAINTSASLPVGFYLQKKYDSGSLRKGDIILFYDDKINAIAYKRGYIRRGEQIGKRVAAVEGDSININALKTVILGKIISKNTPIKDSKKRPMDLFQYKGVVPQGSIFLIGDTSNSFDSRYYGFVNKEKITAILTPLIVW